MPEEIAVTEEPKPPVPVVVEPPKIKLRRVIQPTDKDGKPIGSPHVYVADTQEEMDAKLSDAIANGTRKIRELTLGTPIKITAPDGAELDEAIPEFKPRQLTPEERQTLAAKFANPETIEEAYDELFVARTGGKPEDFTRIQVKSAKDTAVVRARTEAMAFQEAHPEFVPNEANSNAMISYLGARKMACTLKNFDIAFNALTADGLLTLHQPEPEPPPMPKPVVPAPEPPAVPRTEEPVAATRTRGTADLPSSITRTDTSASGSPKSGKPSAKDIAMMTSVQFREAIEKWPELKTKLPTH